MLIRVYRLVGKCISDSEFGEFEEKEEDYVLSFEIPR